MAIRTGGHRRLRRLRRWSTLARDGDTVPIAMIVGGGSADNFCQVAKYSGTLLNGQASKPGGPSGPLSLDPFPFPEVVTQVLIVVE